MRSLKISSSKATKTLSTAAPGSSNPSTTGVDLKEFHLFPKLPFELRSKIWKLNIIPRLVTPTGVFPNTIAAIYHTSREARAESKYESCWDRYLEGLIINFNTDILYLNEWGESHVNFFISAVAEGPLMICKAKRLALVLRVPMTTNMQGWMADSGKFSKGGVQNIFNILEQTVPELRELIYFVRPAPLGSTIDDLYEVYEAKGALLQRVMDDIMRQFQKAQADGKWKSLKLTFMRGETWEP